MKYKITDNCIACGACIDQCKYNAIVQGDEQYRITDACVGCGDCVGECHTAAIISIPNFAMFIGDKIAKKFYVGDKQVRALYAGTAKVWLSVVRVDRGEDYGEWSYDDPIRRRTVTPWEQDIYSDDSVGERRYGTPYTQEETSVTTVDFDGDTYWNGSCGADYYYVDYQKVRDKYTYSDGTVRYSDYRNGEIRSRHIDGQCGLVRSTVVIYDCENTGNYCNAAGTSGAYDCDGTYRVQYHQQMRTVEYRYPDGSGGVNRRYEYRSGSLASRQQVDGYCGYSAKTVITITFSDDTFNSGFSEGDIVAHIYYNDIFNRTVNIKPQGSTQIELNVGEVLEDIYVSIYNSGDHRADFSVIWDGETQFVADIFANTTDIVDFSPSIKYSDGNSTHTLSVVE